MAKSYKNDIFEVIKNIDNKNYNYYDTLSDEQQKEIQPYVLMRWISTVNDEKKHIDFNNKVNNNVNLYFWQLSKYKDLQYKLLCTCGNKMFNKHLWVASSKSNIDKNFKMIKSINSSLTDDEIRFKYKNISASELKEITQNLGLLNQE